VAAILDSLRGARLIGLAVVIGILSGCQVLETQPDKAAEPDPVMAEPEGKPERAPTLQDVILALDAGRVDSAEDQLLDILERRPNSRLASRLLEQIRADPDALADGDDVEVTVAEGESLSEIAERELGDAMQFFALARYNDIDVPRRLEPGQTLRIPEALKVRAEPPAEVPADEAPAPALPVDPGERLNDTARDLLESGRHGLARRLLTLVAYAGQLNERGHALLARAALESAAEREARGELTAAVELLDASRKLLGGADAAALAAERDRLEARVLFAEGMEHRRGDRLDEALEHLERSAALDPTFAAAREEMSQVRELLVLRRHEAALVHYREQRLDPAIELWQSVLRLDPEFEPAQRYLPRARELRSRLKALD
jgi:tetratricopeptide (TPR) repeat protein